MITVKLMPKHLANDRPLCSACFGTARVAVTTTPKDGYTEKRDNEIWLCPRCTRQLWKKINVSVLALS